MKRLVRHLSLGALILLLTTGPASAQATAQLSGTVRDESRGVLPGVTVTVTQTDTGLTRTAVTDATGSYVLPNLPTGPYRLEVSLAGFRTYEQTGIVLQVAAAPVINAVLAVGSVEETVSVEAATPLVDVRSAGISAVVENERIVELPLQGRQVTDLLVLAGAAVQTGVHGVRDQRPDKGQRRFLWRQDADELPQPRRLRAAGARYSRQPDPQRRGRALVLERRSGDFPAHSDGDAAARAAHRVVQPAQPLQLGQSAGELQLGAVRPHHDAGRRPQNHAIWGQI